MINFFEVQNIKELADLAYEIWHEFWHSKLPQGQVDYMLQKFQSEDAIKNQIKNDNYKYFFIQKNEENIGYFGISEKSDFLFLSKIYIKKDFRNKGLGERAFSFIVNYAKNLEYKKIILTVKKDNESSIEAYKKWGFNIIDSVITEIGGGFVMDDFIMEYKI